MLLLSMVLVENAVALLVRRRHPLAAPIGILGTYVIVDNQATTALPLSLALFTVAMARDRRTVGYAVAAAALVVLATPILHGETTDVLVLALAPLLGVVLAVALGISRAANQQNRLDHAHRMTEAEV